MELIYLSLKNFGLYFSEIRERSGFKSQRELAEKSGVSHSTINRIEAGTHKASPETLKLLSICLKGTTYEEMMDKLGYLGTDNYELTEYLKQKSEKGYDHEPNVPYSKIYDGTGRFRFKNSIHENPEASENIDDDGIEENLEKQRINEKKIVEAVKSLSDEKLDFLLEVIRQIKGK